MTDLQCDISLIDFDRLVQLDDKNKAVLSVSAKQESGPEDYMFKPHLNPWAAFKWFEPGGT